MTEEEEIPKKRIVSVENMEMDAEKGDLEPRIYLTIRPVQAPNGEGLAYEVGMGFVPAKVYKDLVSRMNSANKKLKEIIASGERPELKDLMEFTEAITEGPDESISEAVPRVKKYDHMFG